ncbi:MAG: RnfABCDGE type electron transport complex subunit A [Oscillospiraceae bacterium]|jgi:electron transport complex protein RnfA|nr:RnfABCDGE type electron transport complex subunit A [Oscillospiraceae bacterium]
MNTMIGIIIAAVLTNNFVLSKFYGCCPFLGVSKKIDSSIGMGAAVIFVMICASLVTYPIYYFILKPFDLTYLRTVAFILVIAVFVQLLEIVIKKLMPPLYKTLGVYLPLITTNCAVLGVTIMNIDENYTFAQSIVNAAFSGIGFALAMVIFSGVRSRVDDADSETPEMFRGIPATLVAAAIVSMSFLGFGGLGQ